VDAWDGMTADARKQMLAAIFDSITATAEGVDRLEPCADWKPYVAAAIPKPVKVPPADDGCHRSGRRDSNPLSAPSVHYASATVGSTCCAGRRDPRPLADASEREALHDLRAHLRLALLRPTCLAT
jgi:hypothetical protein